MKKKIIVTQKTGAQKGEERIMRLTREAIMNKPVKNFVRLENGVKHARFKIFLGRKMFQMLDQIFEIYDCFNSNRGEEEHLYSFCFKESKLLALINDLMFSKANQIREMYP